MAAKYESKIGQIPYNDQVVYAVLSNLNNLQRFTDAIPKDKVKELEITTDAIRMKIDGLAQKFTIRIVEKEPCKTIKFGVENLPMEANLWIQLKQVAEQDTRIKLTIKADIPMMFRMMFEKKLQQGLDQAVDMLCQVPYNQWV
ncbi:MAG: SRPBCC family protein [Paludibacteraceae bacterium]|jgi:carbon monoxide dehydrogenase subunit G|nr:SRPBCC family protein [Paludibacteraceae bacterium]